jgi:hypothetical protein
MHRCSSRVLLTLTIALATTLTGCLGTSTSNSGGEGIKSVSLSPTGYLSMDVGSTQAFTASATSVNGRSVAGTVQYILSVPQGQSGPAPLSISSNGSACAGTWDTTFAICNPGTPGIATVTAVINGFQSVPTFVYVHYHIDNLKITPVQTIPPQYDCFSQGQNWTYQATAYSNGVDISNTVGYVNWASSATGVLTVTPTVPTNQPNVLNQAVITTDSPGITQLTASVAGTTSDPLPITTCLVQYVRLQIQGSKINSTTVSSGTSVSLVATAVDTLNNVIAKPPLTWSTTNPEVVSFSTLSNSTGQNNATARNNPGGSDVTVSCTPPSCNIGLPGFAPNGQSEPGLPVYASAGQVSPFNPQPGYDTISIAVTPQTTEPTYSAWVATNQCANQTGCTSVMFQVTPSTTNPITATTTLPLTPNSMMFNYQTSSRLYLGSNLGLMYADISGSAPTVKTVSSATTPCNVALCGVVLAITNDGKQVVVSDNVSSTPQVYLYNSSTSAVTIIVLPDVATAAAFSPDESKIFLVTQGGSMYVYSTVDAITPTPISTTVAPTPTSVAFSANGSFAYVAGTPVTNSISGFGACTTPSTQVFSSPFTTSAPPIAVYPSPQFQTATLDQTVTVLDPPYIESFGVTINQPPLAYNEYVCTPPTVTPFLISSVNLGRGNFVPLYSRLVANGSSLILVLQQTPAVLIFNIADGTTTSVPLFNGAIPLGASSSTDGSQVFVAACDQYQNGDPTQPCIAGSTHIVNTISQGDYLQVPYLNYTTNNMCNGQGAGAPLCIANLVAIKPQ